MSRTIAYETAAGPQQVDAAHPLPVNATVTATASTVAKATAAAPTYSEGDVAAPLSVDLAGGLRITGTINATSAATATTAAPSYVNATSNPFSQNLTGDLRVIAKQSGTWTVGLSAGSAIVGSVSIDQTTNGVTNAVDVLNMPLTLDVNSGVKSNSTIRVVLANDQPALTNKLLVTPDLPTGAATAAKQPALGTAGTSSADVITVQGRASMTPLLVDGSAVTQPVSIATAPALVASSALIGNVGHGKTIKTAPIAAITADNDIIAAVGGKRIKVIGVKLFKVGTNANPIIFKSNGTGGTELARYLLQSQASAVFGVVDTTVAPSFLFATVAGEKLTIDVGDTDALNGYLTYFDDDAT